MQNDIRSNKKSVQVVTRTQVGVIIMDIKSTILDSETSLEIIKLRMILICLLCPSLCWKKDIHWMN